MNKDLINKIILLLKENIEDLNQKEILEDTLLISSGYIDSFELINIISILEATFNIKIPIDNIELEDFDTPISIAKLTNEAMISIS